MTVEDVDDWRSMALAGGDRPEPTVSVVIPAKNEARKLPLVFSDLPPDLHEVILVDGHSTDNTVEVARCLRPDIMIVTQSRTGKGNALACGIAQATGDFIVMLDADGSTHPSEIPRFIEALKRGADFAKGSRFMPGAGNSDISRIRQFGNY
jgi:glycosyltransferase involved in cell wall biosynthesis